MWIQLKTQINKNNAISVIIDNSTGYYVDIFVDNIYKGTIDAWGKSTITVLKPFKNIYYISIV